jgi:curved DNA-binding protein CbpA
VDRDPERLYATLGVNPDATQTDITTAFRRQARLLHPDIPGTGDAGRFIALRQAYDLLGDPIQRAKYDQVARQVPANLPEPEDLGLHFVPALREAPPRRPRVSDVPWPVWLVVAGILGLGAYHLTPRFTAAEREVRLIPATAPPGPPPEADSSAARTRLTPPQRLAGQPNHFTSQAQGPAPIWRLDAETNRLFPLGQLPPFTPVQALRFNRQQGLVEIRLSDSATAIIQASRLTPGNEAAARRGFCTYHAGPAPANGAVLRAHRTGSTELAARNRGPGPAVVKLRDPAGATLVAFYLAPGGEAALRDLPNPPFRVDYAFGEVWSAACDSFAVGTQAYRLAEPTLTSLVIPPDPDAADPPRELSEAAFNRD